MTETACELSVWDKLPSETGRGGASSFTAAHHLPYCQGALMLSILYTIYDCNLNKNTCKDHKTTLVRLRFSFQHCAFSVLQGSRCYFIECWKSRRTPLFISLVPLFLPSSLLLLFPHPFFISCGPDAGLTTSHHRAQCM